MANDREQAGLRGPVRRVETNANQLIEWPHVPSRGDQWLDEICVYNTQGNLLEWFSPENQILEQESIMHRFVYDSAGRLVEKHGYDEEGSAEDLIRYYFDDEGKLIEEVHTNLASSGETHILYDKRGNVVRVKVRDGRDGSSRSIQQWHYSYKEHANQLEVRSYREEGMQSVFRLSPQEYRSVTTLDEKGNKIKVERYVNDRVDEISIFNDTGKLSKNTRYSWLGGIASETFFTYDENQNLIKHIFKEGSAVKNSISKYDDLNNLTELLHYENDKLVSEERNTYEYDSQENWTNRIETRENENGFRSTTQYVRRIDYFDLDATMDSGAVC